MTPDQYCQQKAARSGSSFYYSFLFLPPERRRAITALYAYCREVDDAVDEIADPAVARGKLDWWRGEIERLFQGAPQHPVTRALHPFVVQWPLPREHFDAILDGMAMDLAYNRYPDFPTLEVYCHRVAGVVGLLSAEIFGRTDPATLEYARTLGIALQLTNILRDVGEDVRRNRIYIPQDELSRFGVSNDDLILFRETPALGKLLEFQAARAREWYRRAFAALPDVDRRSQRAGLIMGHIYARLLDEVEDEGAAVINRRVSLTPVRKLWIAWRTWAGS
ncbi:MAG: presqualene diphosphate synthase HpnD [Betaproteobacteria bacterium]|nr:presqualene diphosphate synthase HpnD [Betaproteobacteria bacterium]